MTVGDTARTVAAVFDDAIALHRRMRDLDHEPIVAAAAAIRAAFDAGGRLLIFGNGGSAADAQHMAAELVGRFERERAAMPAIALSTDTSILTGIGNDYGYEKVFVRQIEALGRAGDIAFGITTSGTSPNVVAALVGARTFGLKTMALTGRDGGAAGAASDIHINVPDASTARVQEVHRTIIHAICAVVEGSPEGWGRAVGPRDRPER
jgi:D-sedoheptulose 7-phosphate isomerase